MKRHERLLDWADALESGRYKQTQHLLTQVDVNKVKYDIAIKDYPKVQLSLDTVKFCCLGVYANLTVGKNLPKLVAKYACDLTTGFPDSQAHRDLQWLTPVFAHPKWQFPKNAEYRIDNPNNPNAFENYLMYLNDRAQFSFKQIAKQVRKAVKLRMEMTP